ncbi:MAG: hypothetical protein JETT_3392 [Candidatus Jettenia ecosi]|uniref:D-lactate dehydrogenase n=1 Tax=Candidatus Jettenia ecosi TaxID=2494326 RepID=A0A533Q6X1_9BACT|nr:MAG: hypothetical protein JETT_3392 [Candidatus Jettenia ecosi]
MKIAFFEIEAWERYELQALSEAYDVDFISETLATESVHQYANAGIVHSIPVEPRSRF